jgi:hypothetical protein
MSVIPRRVQVPITEDTQALLDALRDPCGVPADSVRELLGELPASEAGLLARLLRLGAERVREAQRSAGYAALAESMDDPEELAYEKVATTHRHRQAAAWADA